MIEAIQWKGNNLFEVITFTDGQPDLSSDIQRNKWQEYTDLVALKGFKIKTLDGWMNASVNDWIIKGVVGELYPCKPDVFEKTYELISSLKLN